MTAAITTLRSTIASALVDNTLWQVFSFPPATPLANSVVVAPADPYITPNNNANITISPLANFNIDIFVPLLDNQGNLNGIEEMVVALFTKLAGSSLVYNIGTVSAPSVASLPSGDLLTCQVQVSVLTSWS